MSNPADTMLALVGLAVIGLLLWQVFRPRYAARIVLDETGVRDHRGLSQTQQPRVLDFLQEHVSPSGKLVIYVQRDGRGVIRVNYRGSIDVGTQQQIRNFLITVL